ncbi:MAG: indole-3-glycerol phosphate synthase [Natronomonas sp.]|uniref:indole-3-glycerol phosphate synthase n=1 Tax=Natronomonas sp. TaxID=2184060 RepID=UPI00287023A3|nr:indole-3-glycerol phosphate synthase [Natronomonas sp.]MDR9380200.1 indole-3-glycerol phosphate synthase [Natronomonas sp.]MDR9429699.1 indole-3-glycerol phosphate synthase [Natronomonas sp.]
MNTREEVAPAVQSILEAAEGRTGGDQPLSVTPRSLPDALAAAETDGRVPLIAEVKPTSPTTDGERTDDPVELAEAMVDGGAAALSVLTEPEHFGGAPEMLGAVREAVDVPVLRKDFILREAQLDVVEADVALLIARFVDDLEGLLAAARDRGFQVLVEAHTPEEVEAAIDAGATIVGVNNRDLGRLDVDLGTFERVADSIPATARESVTLIAESGITSPDDASRMRAAGADGLLVGSAIMDGDVRTNTERLTDV